jgi:hypothetical protein
MDSANQEDSGQGHSQEVKDGCAQEKIEAKQRKSHTVHKEL